MLRFFAIIACAIPVSSIFAAPMPTNTVNISGLVDFESYYTSKDYNKHSYHYDAPGMGDRYEISITYSMDGVLHDGYYENFSIAYWDIAFWNNNQRHGYRLTQGDHDVALRMRVVEEPGLHAVQFMFSNVVSGPYASTIPYISHYAVLGSDRPFFTTQSPPTDFTTDAMPSKSMVRFALSDDTNRKFQGLNVWNAGSVDSIDVQPPAGIVPLPGALWLALAGCGALYGIGRRRA